MKTLKALLPMSALIALSSGCAAPAVISDIHDSAVRVQGNGRTSDEAFMAEAAKGCGLYNKQPVPLSTTQGGPYGSVKQVLFACK